MVFLKDSTSLSAVVQKQKRVVDVNQNPSSATTLIDTRAGYDTIWRIV